MGVEIILINYLMLIMISKSTGISLTQLVNIKANKDGHSSVSLFIIYAFGGSWVNFRGQIINVIKTSLDLNN